MTYFSKPVDDSFADTKINLCNFGFVLYFRYKYTDKYFNEVLKNLEPVFNSYEPDRMALFLPFGIFIVCIICRFGLFKELIFSNN